MRVARYLLNPFGLLSSGAKSSVALSNAAILVCIALAQRGRALFAGAGLAIATYLSLYNIVLLAPLVAFISRRGGTIGVLVLLLAAAGSLAGLLFASASFAGSWSFIEATYGFTLAAPDLTPNIGFMWYFYTEVFSVFKPLFLWSSQLLLFFYCVPLTISLQCVPTFVFLILIPCS